MLPSAKIATNSISEEANMAQGLAVTEYQSRKGDLQKLAMEWPLHMRFPYLQDSSAIAKIRHIYSEVHDHEHDYSSRLPPLEDTPENREAADSAETVAEYNAEIRLLNRYMHRIVGGHCYPARSAVRATSAEENVRLNALKPLSLPQICARELCFRCHNLICVCQ